jgi:hypothetical protein
LVGFSFSGSSFRIDDLSFIAVVHDFFFCCGLSATALVTADDATGVTEGVAALVTLGADACIIKGFRRLSLITRIRGLNLSVCIHPPLLMDLPAYW